MRSPNPGVTGQNLSNLQVVNTGINGSGMGNLGIPSNTNLNVANMNMTQFSTQNNPRSGSNNPNP